MARLLALRGMNEHDLPVLQFFTSALPRDQRRTLLVDPRT